MTASRSIAVVFNASAGTGAARSDVVAKVGELFAAAGCDAQIVSLEPGQDPCAAARAACARAAVVVAAGGDGTVSSVAAGVLGSAAVLGVLPLGTLNHFAKDLHIPMDLDQAVAVVAAGHVRRVDVARVNDRVFLNNSSIGVYPDIVEAREELRRRGHRKWPAMAMATLRVIRRYSSVRVTIEVAGRVRAWRTPFLMVGNNEYEVEGRGIGGRARLDEGRLFVYLAPRALNRDLPALVVKALLGRASRSGAFEIVPATELRIRTRMGGSIQVALDGEVARMSLPLWYRAGPGELPVLVPQT